MGKEIEKRFFNYNKKEVINKIMKEMNGKYKGEHIFKVWKFNIPKNMSSDIHTLRVRDEGFKKTFTIKKRGKNDTYDTEYEVKIQDPQEMRKMLELMDFELDHYYEKIREIYKVGSSEVIFDTYPGMPDSMEVESKNIRILKKMMNTLGLKDDEEDSHKNTNFYKHFHIQGGFDDRIGRCKQGYTFQNVLKHRNLYAKKNQKEFLQYMKKQNQYYQKIKKQNQII